MDGNSKNYNNYLPDDCLLDIFKKLQNTSDRNAFGLTCQHWFNIRNSARKSLVFPYCYNPKLYEEYTRLLPRLLIRCPSLSLISLAGCTQLPDSALNQLKIAGLSLRSLSLYCCSGITDNGLAQLSSGCGNLVTLTLSRCCNITDVGLETLTKCCHALENLNLAYCMAISDRGISAIFRDCPKIRALCITSCKGITGVGFKGCPSTLTYLEADSCALSPEGLSEAVSGGGFEYLNLYNLRNSIGGDSLHRIGHAKRLRFLNLRMCRFLSDDSVVAIAMGCPLLKEWCLAVCHEVRLPGWSAIGLCCNNLKVLHVNRCRNLSDEGLLALREGCERLEVLYLNGCCKVTSEGLELFSMFRHSVVIKREECLSIGPCIDDLFS